MSNRCLDSQNSMINSMCTAGFSNMQLIICLMGLFPFFHYCTLRQSEPERQSAIWRKLWQNGGSYKNEETGISENIQSHREGTA